MVSNDWPTVELDIPTTFRMKNPSPRIPTAADLSLDFKVIWGRIKHLPLSERDACCLHTEGHRLAARVFRFPRHLSYPEVEYPCFYDLPALEKMAQNLGVLGQLRLGANINWAPAAAARPIQELKVILGSSIERLSREEEVPPLTWDKKRKMVEAETLPIKVAPAQPIVEQKEKAFPAKQATARGEPKHGRALFGCDREKYARARSDDTNRPALVINFLTARPRQHDADIPSHVARVLESLPKGMDV
ncbi:hypothetical protein OROMI_025023 [Orobanche minor]